MIKNASCASPCRHPKLVSIEQPVDNDENFYGQKIGIFEQGSNMTREGRIRHVGHCPPRLVLWKVQMWCGKTDSERSGVGSQKG